MMDDSKSIERVLSSNSSMPSSVGYVKLVGVDLKSQYRPDKVFSRDEFMKWDMIYNNVDTPHRLVRGSIMSIVDRTALRTEINELVDFKI